MADLVETLVTDDEGFGEPVILPDAIEALGIFSPAPSGSYGQRDHDYGGDQYAPPSLLLTAELADTLDEKQLVTARGNDYAISRIDRGMRPDGLVRLTLRPVR